MTVLKMLTGWVGVDVRDVCTVVASQSVDYLVEVPVELLAELLAEPSDWRSAVSASGFAPSVRRSVVSTG